MNRDSANKAVKEARLKSFMPTQAGLWRVMVLNMGILGITNGGSLRLNLSATGSNTLFKPAFPSAPVVLPLDVLPFSFAFSTAAVRAIFSRICMNLSIRCRIAWPWLHPSHAAVRACAAFHSSASSICSRSLCGRFRDALVTFPVDTYTHSSNLIAVRISECGSAARPGLAAASSPSLGHVAEDLRSHSLLQLPVMPLPCRSPSTHSPKNDGPVSTHRHPTPSLRPSRNSPSYTTALTSPSTPAPCRLPSLKSPR
mmetsp:Transcript_15166/g.35928  ORF Transcript_15166/g.35928 Transcript_15166/m.35928 type:complete len:255 (+) Transcript_15166:448-1212(+)